MKITKTRIIIYNLIIIFVVFWLPRILIALSYKDPNSSLSYIGYILTPAVIWTVLAIAFGVFTYWIIKDPNLNQKQKLSYISLQILIYLAATLGLDWLTRGLF